MNKQTIILFDFDGTITRKDSFLLFIRFSKGNFRFWSGMIVCAPILIAWKCRMLNSGKAKQMVFSHFFRNVPVSRFNQWCKDFSEQIEKIVRPKALNQIREYQAGHIPVLIVSASIENWILPWARKNGIDRVIATGIETDQNNVLTGSFSTPNCKGQEKVNRLHPLFPNRPNYFFIAYGDSSGDKELLAFSDQSYYRVF